MDCTLLSEGSSDRMLIPAIKWLLDNHFPNTPFNIEYADLRGSAKNQISLPEKICLALELYPCDILFVHRDTDRDSYVLREGEILSALEVAECSTPKVIPVIPSKMSEAWLLIDENALKLASGNPNGKILIKLPKLNSIESIANPKGTLIDLLKRATGLSNRRRRSFNPNLAIHNLAENIIDYSPLRSLNSFQLLENNIKELKLEE